ncbi:ankyrin repeat-containing domain protein [Aspergillus heterothallicus]
MPTEKEDLDWDAHKNTLWSLWFLEGRTRQDIMKFMAENFNFHAKAHQYDRKYKDWGCRKNLKAEEWRIIGSRISRSKEEIEEEGKTSSVYINGMPVSANKIKKETRRNDFPSIRERYCPAPRPNTPDGVYICTSPSMVGDSHLWDNLPWANFMRALTDQENLWPNLGLLAANLPNVARGFLETVPTVVGVGYANLLSWSLAATPETRIKSHLARPSSIVRGFHLYLRAILPDIGPSEQILGSICYDELSNTVVADYFGLLCYQVSNGLDRRLTCGDLIKVIQHLARAHMLQFHYNRQSFTMQAVLERLFSGAVREGNAHLVRDLLNAGILADVNASGTSHLWETALQHVTRNSRIDIMEMLLEARAQPNARPSYRRETALQTAVDYEDIAAVRLLLNSGADPNLTDNINEKYRCQTALQKAAYHEDSRIFELLLDAGADVNAVGGRPATTAVYEAAKVGNVGLVELLLSKGAEVNPKMLEKLPIEGAARSGNITVVKRLISAGADVNAGRGSPCSTAIQQAANSGNIELIQLLLDEGADINAYAENSIMTVVQAAVSRGSIEVLQLLIDNGADVNMQSKAFPERSALQTAVHYMDHQLFQALIQGGLDVTADRGALQVAIERNDLDWIRILLSHGADLNAPEEDWPRRSPLATAAYFGHYEIARTLLDLGADVDGSTDSTWSENTPLGIAMIRKHHEIANLLLQHGANINAAAASSYRATILQEAIGSRNFELTQHLLKLGADVNAPPAESGGKSALQEACRMGDLKLVNLLVCAGADVNGPPASRSGETALSSAVLGGNIDVVLTLLKGGARPDYPGLVDKGTPLQLALLCQKSEIVRLLLDAGADLNAPAQRKRGRTALQAAVEDGNIDLVQQFLDAGADVHGAPALEDGTTALQSAARQGLLGIAIKLLQAGADVNEPPPPGGGRTALQEAAMHGRLDMVQLLLNGGIDRRGMRELWFQTAIALALDFGHFAIAEMLSTHHA